MIYFYAQTTLNIVRIRKAKCTIVPIPLTATAEVAQNYKSTGSIFIHQISACMSVTRTRAFR